MPFGADVFEANTGGDGPFADIDFVIDIEGVGFGTPRAVLVYVAVALPARRRHIVDQVQAAGLLVHAFFEVAITHADFLGTGPQVEHMGHTRLDANGVVGARVGAEGLEVAVGNGAATEAVGIVSQHFGLGTVVDLADVLEGHVLAAPAEVVPVTHRLVRVGVELLLGQAAGHIGAGIVIMEVQREIVLIGRRPVGLEDHVIDVVAVVAVAVTVAIDPGVQQRGTDTVVGRAADKGVFHMLPAPVGRRLQGGADFPGEVLRDRAGHEVDHAANVLWPITHRTRATDNVDTFQVTGRNRRHRQLWLAVGSKRRRYAINQHSGSR